MTTIAIDGLSEEEFRRSIESGLRRGRAGEAVAKLRELIEPFAGDGRILPARFLTVDAADLALRGWDELGDRIRRYDRPGRLVSAISIAFGWPGEDVPQPDAEGRLSPLVEVGYYNDDAFPFSRSGREDLLDGYSFHGCTWGDDCVGTDTALVLEGISDLHGALAALEARLLACEEPDPDEICAGSLGACLLSALLYQAVADKVAEQGLPRPLCVMAGSNGVYPYFDAPVAGMPMDVLKAARIEDEEDNPLDTGVPGPRYSSLVMTGIKRAPKRAVLVLQESEEEMAVRIASLRGLTHSQPDAAPAPPLEPPAVAAARPEEDGIIDLPISPLMTKKPHGQGWDFRDLLSPRDPDSPDPGEPQPASTPDFSDRDEPEPDWCEATPGEPEAIRDPACPAATEAEPEPGFSLVEAGTQTDLQLRLLALLASPAVPDAPADDIAPQPEPFAETAVETGPIALAAAPAPPEVTAPHWPLGLGWLECDEADSAPQEDLVAADLAAANPPAGLLARLRGLLGLLRRSPPRSRNRKLNS